MIRLRALLTMTAFFAALAVAWVLTIELWCDRGARSGPTASAPKAVGSPGTATAALRGRPSAASRPSTRSTRRARASESRTAAFGDSDGCLITGRVVVHGGHEPVPEARLRFGFVGESQHLGGYGVADRDGCFRFSIPKGDFASATLDVQSSGHCGARTVSVPPPYSGIRDLGDVELAEFRTVWFLVTSADGAPVGGAMVQSEPDVKMVEETDADGTGSIELDPGPQTLRVMAFGFEFVNVSVPPFDDSITVRLTAASTLVVRVTTPVGEPNPDTTSVRIESDQSPCELTPGDGVWKLIGNTVPQRQDSGCLSFFKTRVVRLSPIRAGLKLTVVVREGLIGQETREVVTLAPGERRVLDIVLRGDYRRLCGRVTGERDRPIAGATVQFDRGSQAAYAQTRQTDENGSFDFGAISDPAVDLQVSSEKHGCWRAKGMRPPESPLVIRLDQGEPVKVEVVDAEGRPMQGASVYALDRHGMTGPEGCITLQHLPHEAFPVEAFYGKHGSAERAFASPAVTVRLDGLGH